MSDDRVCRGCGIGLGPAVPTDLCEACESLAVLTAPWLPSGWAIGSDAEDAKDDRASQILAWLDNAEPTAAFGALWRSLPAAQRAAAAMELRGVALGLADRLLAESGRALGRLPNRALRLSASAAAATCLAALLDRIASESDAKDEVPR